MNTEKAKRIYIADFETTITDTEHTEVWATATVELFSDAVTITNSIAGFTDLIEQATERTIIYFHNLKFDGSFIMNWLFRNDYYHAYELCERGSILLSGESLKDADMPCRSFKYLISDMGAWYNIKIKNDNGVIIDVRDSFKLLPFSVKQIGKAFNTKHQKLSIDYGLHRSANEELSDEEREYIANDVLVIKEAIEIMQSEGHDRMTIGSCALSEFKKSIPYKSYQYIFPDLTKYKLDRKIFKYPNADMYIRKSYHGGWCYVQPSMTRKVIEGGVTYDVNSLYPSMMMSTFHSFPIGEPTFWSGNYIPSICNKGYYYFVRFKTRFTIKPNHLPTIQVKSDPRYSYKEWLMSSKPTQKRKHPKPEGIRDLYENEWIVMTLTQTDFILFKDQYDAEIEILDGCYFATCNGIFDEYIEKYRLLKEESTRNGNKGMRTIAKLFLNNLYGKMASNSIGAKKVAELDENGILKFRICPSEKKAGYIPIGSCITSYAREYTIRAAQENYDRFIYADTDSIHLTGTHNAKNIKIHDTEFGAWKHESTWERGWFLRPKAYIEVIDGFYDIKCSGMSDAPKMLFRKMLESGEKELKDFDIGLTLAGKLMPKQVEGGVILREVEYTLRP